MSKLSIAIIWGSVWMLFSAVPSHSAVQIFLQIEGIEGEAMKEGFENQIEVTSFSWSMTQPTTITGSGAGGSLYPVIEDLVILKGLDKATPALLLHLCEGRYVPQAVLTVIGNVGTGGANDKILEIILERVIISSVQTSVQGGAEVISSETISLRFEQFTMEYFLYRSDGSPNGSQLSGWNVLSNTPPS